MIEFKDTIELMLSEDYKERFKAEYHQTKLRYERLKALNTKIEAANTAKYAASTVMLREPRHDCPESLLRDQQTVMGQYLHILEVRAEIEGIELK